MHTRPAAPAPALNSSRMLHIEAARPGSLVAGSRVFEMRAPFFSKGFIRKRDRPRGNSSSSMSVSYYSDLHKESISLTNGHTLHLDVLKGAQTGAVDGIDAVAMLMSTCNIPKATAKSALESFDRRTDFDGKVCILLLKHASRMPVLGHPLSNDAKSHLMF